MESARDLAINKNNYFALVLAQNALGAIYVRNGELEKGIATLEATRNGNILKDGGSTTAGAIPRSRELAVHEGDYVGGFGPGIRVGSAVR